MDPIEIITSISPEQVLMRIIEQFPPIDRVRAAFAGSVQVTSEVWQDGFRLSMPRRRAGFIRQMPPRDLRASVIGDGLDCKVVAHFRLVGRVKAFIGFSLCFFAAFFVLLLLKMWDWLWSFQRQEEPGVSIRILLLIGAGAICVAFVSLLFLRSGPQLGREREEELIGQLRALLREP